MLYRNILRPLLFALSRNDPEIAHELALRSLKKLEERPRALKWLHEQTVVKDARLTQHLFGLTFPNPVGLAAGFDKNAEAISGLSALGFGFLEIGTVTCRETPGDVRPRILRLRNEKALVNWMRFPNHGAIAAMERLARIGNRTIPVGINIGVSGTIEVGRAEEYFSVLLSFFYPYTDYFVFNLSTPNTPDVRKLQEPQSLQRLLRHTRAVSEKIVHETGALRKPLLIKISPDLSNRLLDEMLAVCLEENIDGIIATNTTICHTHGTRGGLSGKPLFPRALDVVEHIHGTTKGKFPIIGVGGIANAADAYAMLRAGASLVQIYTALVYQGPFVVKKINRGLCTIFEQQSCNGLHGATTTI